MGKFLHIFIKTASLAVLVVVVFLMNAYTVVFKKTAKDDGSERLFANDFSIGFSANKAQADVTAVYGNSDSCDEGGSDGSGSDGSDGSGGSK